MTLKIRTRKPPTGSTQQNPYTPADCFVVWGKMIQIQLNRSKRGLKKHLDEAEAVTFTRKLVFITCTTTHAPDQLTQRFSTD